MWETIPNEFSARRIMVREREADMQVVDNVNIHNSTILIVF